MAVTIDEKFESRAGDNQSLELAYVIRGTDDDLAARAALGGAAPAVYYGLWRQDDSLRVEPVGPLLWQGSARYSNRDNSQPQTGESVFSFDTGGGSQHVTQSMATVARYAPSGGGGSGGAAPDFRGAIGVTHDSVEGVDITVPVYQFSETHYLPEAAVTLAYRGVLFSLTGRVNSGGFRGLAAGECLFLGASGSKRGASGGDWEITFRFAGSPNATGLTVGDITGVNKLGWEYLWVRYEDGEDSAAMAIVKRPAAVYIEKVYELGDFAGLGIGS